MTNGDVGGGARLTPLAKVFITVVVLGVVGYATWHYFGDDIRCWSNPDKCTQAGGSGRQARGSAAQATGVGRDDFAALGNPPADPTRQGVGAVTTDLRSTVTKITGGRLNRPLRVGINTWAGHAPGIVANLGLATGNAQSIFKRGGIDVELTLLDDPAAKFAAFQAGQIDVMWDTVDSWAREASLLAEHGSARGKAILMQDWSRGGDGIVAVDSIRSVEDLAGKRIATTQFTPSHWLLLYLLSQSGLNTEQRAQIERDLVLTQDAPAAAAMFRAGRVDAAVTWEPDLSGAVAGRAGSHVLVSTTAATNVIADVLVAREDVINQAPETLAIFVAGWFEGIEEMRRDPTGTNTIIGNALHLDNETVSGMLSGLKLTVFADNAQFFGLTGTRAHYETLFDTAFRIWRRKGVVSRVVEPNQSYDTRFVAAVADRYRGQQIQEPRVAARRPSERDIPILNKQLSINFTPGSAEIMPGSYFTLDSLGETMTSFGSTILRIEGNTDTTGPRQVNVELSQRRSVAVRDYVVRTFHLPPERFQTLGRGPDNPVAPNTTEAGRQLNRRTDIKVILATQ